MAEMCLIFLLLTSFFKFPTEFFASAHELFCLMESVQIVHPPLISSYSQNPTNRLVSHILLLSPMLCCSAVLWNTSNVASVIEENIFCSI